MSAGATGAQIAIGAVRHARLRPTAHRFEVATYFLLLPLRSLRTQPDPALARNRFGLLAFHDRDHGDGRNDCLAWLDEQLAREGVQGADGEVWLQTYPRVLGYAFKPVSFWYCQRVDGSLAAVVVEVNNTFGERHCYLLCGPDLAWGREQRAAKVFHVSPFCAVDGEYRFRFMTTAGNSTPSRIVARIDYDDEQGALINTSVSGCLQALDAQAVRKAMLSYGAMTLAVIGRIHWQAVKLFFKRVPFFSKPSPPKVLVTR